MYIYIYKCHNNNNQTDLAPLQIDDNDAYVIQAPPSQGEAGENGGGECGAGGGVHSGGRSGNPDADTLRRNLASRIT